ncbi:MAG: ATP synthase F0 subunit B [Geothrix sp.]|nr:ATP synthase F0 subunit B [Geothrix sp.]
MKLIRLSLAATLAFSPLGLVAQAHDTHAAPAVEKHEAQSAGHEARPAEGHAPTGAAPEAPEAHGAEAAHHGPAMKLFGREFGIGGAFLVQLLNFAIYGAVLFFLLKGALSAMFKSRREELETMLAQAERDKAESEAQMKDLEAKMAGLEGELAGILSKAETDAEAEKQRVLEAARAEATQILAQAQAEIGHQKRQAEQELRALVAELAVEGATRRLEARLQGPEAAKAAGGVMDRAIQQIGGAQ